MTGDPGDGYSRGTLRRIAELEGGTSGYHVLWKSVFIAYRVHAVRKSLPGEARTQLRDLLSSMFEIDPVAYDSIEPIYGGGFIPARQGQFDPLTALLKPPAGDEQTDGSPGDAKAAEPQTGDAAAPEGAAGKQG